ncbi:endonuclease/exonuclease/phosphatase family protein [Nonomuraea sp. NPDC050556]|uniref:endonuclease/exonuclease/phosphatase family protein n=1 Tax=Nonomuraea sp. NPDC050556 TaxID=3364369 RepID=UPI00379588A9
MGKIIILTALLGGSLISPPDTFDLNDLRVTTYNTMLPADDLVAEEALSLTKRDERAEQIARNPYLLGSDILVLEELYDTKSQKTITDGLKGTFPHSTPEVGAKKGWKATTGNQDDRPHGGGVKIFSRYPIKEMSQHLFKESCGVNDKTRQGFAYAKVEPVPGTFVNVIGVQVQSYDRKGCPYGGRFEEGAEIRTGQYEEIRSFVDGLPEDEPVVIAGDLVADLRQEEYMYMVDSLNVAEPERPGPAQYSTSPVATLDWKAQALRDYVFFAADHPTPDRMINRVQPIHGDGIVIDDYDNARNTIDLSYRHAITNWDGCADRAAKCTRYKVTVDGVHIDDDEDWWPKGAGEMYGSVLIDGLPVWYHTQDDYESVDSGDNLATLVPVEARPNLGPDGKVPVDVAVWDDDSIGFGISFGLKGDDEVGLGHAQWTPEDGPGQHKAEFNDGNVVVTYTVTEMN